MVYYLGLGVGAFVFARSSNKIKSSCHTRAPLFIRISIVLNFAQLAKLQSLRVLGSAVVPFVLANNCLFESMMLVSQLLSGWRGTGGPFFSLLAR